MDTALRNKRHIVAFALITALCLLGDSMLYIALPLHYAERGLDSLWEVGIILAVNRLTRLPLNPVIGRLYSHISERTGIVIAIALGALTTLSYGFLEGIVWWVLVRCLWGLAWSLLRLGSIFCILKISTPQTRGSYNGLYNGLYRLGSLFGMLGGGLLADIFGFRTCVVIFGLSTICALPLILFIPRDDGREHAQQKQPGIIEGFRLTAHNRETLLTIMCGTAVSLVIQGVLASTLSHLVSVHVDKSIQWGGLILGAGTLAGLFQALRWTWEPWLAPLTGRLADIRYGWQKMLLYAFGLEGISFVLLALSLPLPFWFAALLAAQIAATALRTLTDTGAAAVAANLDGEKGRSLLMTYVLLSDMGAAFGPLVAYGLNALWGIDFVYIFCGLWLVAWVFIWRPHAARTTSQRA